MSRGVLDWQNLGIWPLQDHDIDGVELGMRLQMVGARISHVPDVTRSDSPGDAIVRYANDGDKGTIGDIHPWMFWQTDDRDKRDTGSWAQAFAVRITGTSGGFSGGATGTGTQQMVQYRPIRTSGYAEDARYVEKSAGVPPGAPPPAVGDVCIVMPGTDEASQQEVLICGGGGAGGTSRLVCPTKEGPAVMGTLVIDLQPFGELCMDNSPIPGIGGRHARLQSVFRVIPMDQGAAIGAGAGNSVAINHSLSPLDSLAGFGMTWCRLDGGGPITPSRGGVARKILQAKIDDPIGPPLPPGPIGPPLPPGRGGGGGLSESGKFTAVKHPGHGIAYLAHLGAFGPLHGGNEADKHRIGLTRDGEVCNSSHLATQALWYQDGTKDGPMLFEQEPYPDPPDLSLTAKVHLVWDGKESHAWLRGNRDGKWRWYCESPVISPETNGPQVTGGSTGVTTGQGRDFPVTQGPTTGVTGPGGQPGGPGTFTGGRQPSSPGPGVGGGFFTGGRLPSAPRRRLDPPGLFPETRRGNLPLFPGGGPGGKPQPQPRSLLPSKPIKPPRFEFDRIWAGNNPLRPGNPDPHQPGGGSIGLPSSQQPGSTLHRPITPGGSRQPSQGLGWEHYMGRSAPLPPSAPSFPASRAPSIGPGTGRGPNFGQGTSGSAGFVGGGEGGFPQESGGSAPPGD